MGTEAYGDYRQRLREALALLRIALNPGELDVSAGCSKGSIVLAAAALERYLNDVIGHLCKAIVSNKWSDLPAGQRRYLVKQMARRLEAVVGPLLRTEDLPDEGKSQKLRSAVEECGAAFLDPGQWSYHPEFGIFRHGKDVCGRIPALLQQFSATNRSPYESLDERGWERSVFLRALEQLIDARHGVAHALPDSSAPSPKDAQAWIVLSFWLVRRFDSYIEGEAGQ